MLPQEHNQHINRQLLIIEDEKPLRTMLMRAISDMNFIVQGVETAEEAITILQQRGTSVVLTDLNLPGMHGIELCELVRNRLPEIQIIILTGFGDLNSARQGHSTRCR